MPLINLQLSLKLPPKLVPHCIVAVGYSYGRKVIAASGTCTSLSCQVQLLTDGCEELRICLAQHGGLVLALGLVYHCQALFLGSAGLQGSRASAACI